MSETASGLRLPDSSQRLETILADLRANFETIESTIARYGSSYDLFFSTLQATNGYQGVYYNSFTADNAVKTGPIGWNNIDSSYTSLEAGGRAAFQAFHEYPKTVFGFYLHADARGFESDLAFEYSVDNTVWLPAVRGINTVATGTQSLWVRATWLAARRKLYSLAVLYDQVDYTRYSDSRMLEKITLGHGVNIFANTDVTLPNGAVYTLGGKGLEIFWNPAFESNVVNNSSRLLVAGTDYLEVDEFTVRFLVNIIGPGTVLFRQSFDITRFNTSEFAWTLETLPVTVLGPTRIRLPGNQLYRRLTGRSLRMTNSTGQTVQTHVFTAGLDNGNTVLDLLSNYPYNEVATLYYGLSPEFAPTTQLRPLIRTTPPLASTQAPLGTLCIVYAGAVVRTFYALAQSGNTTFWEEYYSKSYIERVEAFARKTDRRWKLKHWFGIDPYSARRW